MVDKYTKRRATQIHMDAIAARHATETAKQIHQRCRGCVFGEKDGNKTLCRNQYHPGYVGGTGTEWALNCANYQEIDAPGWIRTEFCSIWKGPDIELIVIQSNASSETWRWTARGWREPDEGDGTDSWGWIEVSTRQLAEATALRFYLEKDE